MSEPGRPQNLVGIKDGVLHVQVDLMSPNGNLVAHGMLGKATFLVEEFLAEQAIREQALLADKATNGKAAIDLALARK